MKRALALVGFLLLSIQLYACLSAHQDRIFPVGITPDAVVVVEMHLSRGGGERGWSQEIWRGTSWLKKYDKQYKEISRVFLDTLRFDGGEYQKYVSASFSKGLTKAKEIKGIELLAPVYLSFCDFNRSCKLLSLVSDTIQNSFHIKVKGKEYPVTVLRNSAGTMARDFMKWAAAYDMNIGESTRSLSAGSIRKYKIGNRELVVVHLATGQVLEPAEGVSPNPPRKEHTPRHIKFNTIQDSAYEEPVFHHGHGFDFFFFL